MRITASKTNLKNREMYLLQWLVGKLIEGGYVLFNDNYYSMHVKYEQTTETLFLMHEKFEQMKSDYNEKCRAFEELRQNFIETKNDYKSHID